MNLKKVMELLELMETHGLDEIEVEEGDVRIRLRKSGSLPIPTPVIVAPMQVVASNNGSGAAEAVQPKGQTENEDVTHVTSPMVGTFYRSPTPDAEPFVDAGDLVTPDQVVCIIEAMKVMNEIKAELEGEVVRFLVESGESVEYGQPLVVVRRTGPPSK